MGAHRFVRRQGFHFFYSRLKDGGGVISLLFFRGPKGVKARISESDAMNIQQSEIHLEQRLQGKMKYFTLDIYFPKYCGSWNI
jgi:hypothetical protein